MKPLTFNNIPELSDNDIDQITAILGFRCRQKTLIRLRSLLKYGKRLIPSYGLLERITFENGVWNYTAGQSYLDEIRTIRELIIKGDV